MKNWRHNLGNLLLIWSSYLKNTLVHSPYLITFWPSDHWCSRYKICFHILVAICIVTNKATCVYKKNIIYFLLSEYKLIKITFLLSEYARENLVMFNIFIKDPYAKRFQKDEKITKTSYIANSGGLLGLCMGFSLISGAEILYHCFFGIYSALFPSEKKKERLRARKSELAQQPSFCQHVKTPLYDSATGSAVQDWTDVSQQQTQQQNCCNFQHIVQLQDGTAHNVLCSNLNLAPIRLRNQLKNVTCQTMGNGSCVSAQQTTTESTHTGPERII